MKKLNKAWKYILVTSAVLLAFVPSFVVTTFGELNFDQILFTFVSDPQGGNFDVVFDFILATLPYLILSILLVGMYEILKLNPTVFKLKIFKKQFEAQFPPKPKRSRTFIFVLVYLLTLSFVFDSKFMISSYLEDVKDVSNLFETYYVSPEEVKLTFPRKKQNLIVLVLESMNSNFNEIVVDDETVNLIPHLESLAQENISFSNSDTLGGSKQMSGLTWTIAALVGLTSGINLKVPIDGNAYGKNGAFLPGMTNLGDILEKEGYTNHFLIGSDAEFAGRDVYFKTHGNHKVIDYERLKEENYIPEDYHVFWGMEDVKLFDYAKGYLSDLAKKEEPFNLTMLTVDSHFMDGYTDEACDLPYEVAYANAISCSDQNVVSFLNWIFAQDFYEDTTIVITGDHYSMNNEFLSQSRDEDYAIYNVILNAQVDDLDEVVYAFRDFTIMDLFPTTLASMGVEIEGDQLGLGTNLFSDKKTLLEKLGYDSLNSEIRKKSKLYNTFYR